MVAPSPTPSPFPIVCIGASAGGLQAFTQLLQALPFDTGMAFVLVQHLSPDHESILPEILSRSTAMPVRQVVDGTVFRPNHVEVIPPEQDIAVVDGHMVLVERTGRGRHLPVDLCMRTLSAAHHEQAIGIVLSGTGSDGTLGLTALKAGGGISFAQDPATATYDGMPQSAIASGCVDFILSPAGIAAELSRLAQIPWVRELVPSEPPMDDESEGLERVYALLRKHTGVDFSGYKKTTLGRRLGRRMAVVGVDTVSLYAAHLTEHTDEVQLLFDDLLIHVTSFFRDPETFDVLARDLFPLLLQNRVAGAPVRVWVPGCATGEEAYSMAICLLEAAAKADSHPQIQVFATDVSESAVQKARAGAYLENIVQDVSPDRLQRFFTSSGGMYHVNKTVRDVCVFARQDLTRDPPFSRLDLVTCRNVLIYLEPALQRRILATFHYALRPEGYLLLGTSETAGVSSDLFQPVDRQHKTYARTATAPNVLSFGPLVRGGRGAAVVPSAPAPADRKSSRSRVQREADRILAARYGPASVLVDESLEILQFRGVTEPYLGHPPGEASFNLARMARPGLLPELRSIVQEARVLGGPVRRAGLSVRHGDRDHAFDLEAIPLAEPGGERQVLILFDAAPSARTEPLRPGDAREARTQQLEAEIETLRHRQQVADDEHEAAREELQTAGEEILSSNEELQSINEELEAGKEELQSSMEELSTLNEELRNRNLMMARLNDDLANLQASADVSILMLDATLAVRRFTPGAARLFNVGPADVGRPVGELRPRLTLPDLDQPLRDTIATAQPSERELQDVDGRWHRLHLRPYRTQDNRIDGVVLVAVDVDALKRSADAIAAARDFALAVVSAARDPLLILDRELRVVQANPAFYRVFATSPEKTERRHVDDLPDAGWGREMARLRPRLEQVLPGNQAFDGFEIEREAPGEQVRHLHVSARPLVEATSGQHILLAFEDVTDREAARRSLERALALEQSARQKAQDADHLKDDFIASLSHELRGPLSTMSSWIHSIESSQAEPDITRRGHAAIGRAVATQSRLIEDLLDVSRIAAGRMTLAVRMIDLRPVVHGVVEGLLPATSAKDITVDMAIDPAEVPVIGDPERLHQVIWNLVSNAVKFVPRGGRIRIELGRVSNEVRLVIADDGPGIDPDFLPHVFSRFRQGEVTPGSQSGLGLGLTIVRQLVELQGGTVRAESPGPGAGSTFTVTLPVPALREPRSDDTAAAGVLRGISVLVVEDDVDSREMLVIVLSRVGAQVRATSSAAEAMASLADDVPDVMVSDIGMPQQDGYSLIRAVRALPPERGGTIPALALTAFSDVKDRLLARDAGFDDHLPKPADTAALIRRIGELARAKPR